jgi:hypothetical protein
VVDAGMCGKAHSPWPKPTGSIEEFLKRSMSMKKVQSLVS